MKTKKAVCGLLLILIGMALIMAGPLVAPVSAATQVFCTPVQGYNAVTLSYGNAAGEHWVTTDNGGAAVYAQKSDKTTSLGSISVPAGADGYVNYDPYVNKSIAYIEVVFQGQSYSFPVTGLLVEFYCKQVQGENKVILTNYCPWPNQTFNVSSENDSGYQSVIKACDANKNALGMISIPLSANGLADYSSYVARGIKYIQVNENNGTWVSNFFEVAVTSNNTSNNTAGNASQATTPNGQENNTNAAAETTQKIAPIHIVFTKVPGEAYKIHAQCDNGQYGKSWWGIWDISTEGDWAAKVYALDAGKNVLGQLSVPDSALGVLDYSQYKDRAAYIQVDHPMCTGIYDIAANKTILGTLNDRIKEGAVKGGDNPGNVFEKDKIFILVVVLIIIVAIIITRLAIKRNQKKIN
jgi:hypothetical protein